MIIVNKRYQTILLYQDLLNSYKSQFHGEIALSKYKNWFPLLATPKLSGLVADLMGDGHLQDTPKWRLDYCSKHRNELLRFGNVLSDIFGIKGKIRRCTTNKYGTMNYGVNCKPLSRLLKLIGVPTGAKIKKEFLIPDWIINDKENFRWFVVRLFTCESSRYVGKYPWIGIEMWKSIEKINNGLQFMNQIRKYLRIYFNIYTSNLCVYRSKNIRKDKIITKPIKFTILAKSQINFYKEIKLEDVKKHNEIKLIIKRRNEIN